MQLLRGTINIAATYAVHAIIPITLSVKVIHIFTDSLFFSMNVIPITQLNIIHYLPLLPVTELNTSSLLIENVLCVVHESCCVLFSCRDFV